MEIILHILLLIALVASVVLCVCLWKIYQNKLSTKKPSSDSFPIKRLIWGALFGALIAYSSYKNTASFNTITLVRETHLPYLFYFVFALIIGFIPMLIAHTRNTKNANKVYWFSFAAMCAPLGVIWLITALIMAIFGKPKNHAQNNKYIHSQQRKTSNEKI